MLLCHRARLKRCRFMSVSQNAEEELEDKFEGESTMKKEITLRSIVGEELLMEVQSSYLRYLESAGAIYEMNGDYAAALFASRYCDFLNQASKTMAGKTDNEALKSGNWICHEDCWATSLESIQQRKPCEVECSGGIRIYAVPIIAEGTVIGSNNAGVSNPPTDEKKINEIAGRYKVDPKELLRIAKEYIPRPEYVLDAARNHISATAKTIAEVFSRKRAEEEIFLRKRAEGALRESEKRYRTIFEQAADSIVLIDAVTGALVEFNDRAHESLGYTRKEFQELKIPDFEVVESAAEVAKHIKRIVREGTDTFETKHRRKDGEVRDILVDSAALSLGGKEFIQSIWHDTTERKKAEEKLKKAYADLARTNEELQRLNERKSQFVSAVSHEFRTPLVVIRSFSDILAKKKLGRVNEEQQQKLKAIVKHADYLGSLVNNLLDLHRIEAREMKPELRSLSLERLVEESVATLVPVATEKDVEIVTKLDENLPLVLGDEKKLIRILNNLLSNGIKFTDRKGKVTIRAKEVANQVQIDVKDNGMGIPAKHLSKVFDEFHRVPTREARAGWGTGLGLTIVRHLVEEQKGTVWVKSSLGKGSTFSFTLPKTTSVE